MLIINDGYCDKCGRKLTALDTMQSTQVVCNTCGKKMTLCRQCKQVRCECGGYFEDAWARYKTATGGDIMF